MWEGTESVATKTPTKSSEDQAELLKCFQKMQSKMLATQANAVAVQNFPLLPSFTGEAKTVRHKKMSKEPDSVYELPGVQLFGKDGPQGSPEILVRAELDLSVQAGDKVVQAPVLVQPTSEQECLISMNVAPGLELLCYKSARTPVNLQVLASFRLFEYLADWNSSSKPLSEAVTLKTLI